MSPVTSADEIEQMSAGSSTPAMSTQPFTLPLTVPSLAWESNFLTMAVLGAFLAALPEFYRTFVYGILVIVVVDAAQYYTTKGKMAGVPYTLPFVSLASMLLDPVRFWAEQADLAVGSGEGVSSNTFVGKFVVFVTDAKLCREIMAADGIFQLYKHPNARWLLSANCVMHLKEEPHKAFCDILTPALVSNEALAMYATAQERVCRQCLKILCDEGKTKAVDIRIAFARMTATASLESFVGPHLNDSLCRDLESDLRLFTLGFLGVPVPLLDTRLNMAIRAKGRIQQHILKIIPDARAHIDTGKHPRCVLEHWLLTRKTTANEWSAPKVPGCTDLDLVTSVLEFLFAAQDKVNSALTTSVDVLATRPDVVAKIRREFKSQGTDDICTMIQDSKTLQYTRMVVNQVLHHRPPVPMVPYLAKKATSLGGYSIPKGSIVIPSIAYAARMSEVGLAFDPERTDPDSETVPIFGAGQHKCPGQRYVQSFLTVFLGVVAGGYDLERVGPRPSADDIIYLPTLFPAKNDFLITERS